MASHITCGHSHRWQCGPRLGQDQDDKNFSSSSSPNMSSRTPPPEPTLWHNLTTEGEPGDLGMQNWGPCFS